jgi:hypothetical protein
MILLNREDEYGNLSSQKWRPLLDYVYKGDVCVWTQDKLVNLIQLSIDFLNSLISDYDNELCSNNIKKTIMIPKLVSEQQEVVSGWMKEN